MALRTAWNYLEDQSVLGNLRSKLNTISARPLEDSNGLRVQIKRSKPQNSYPRWYIELVINRQLNFFAHSVRIKLALTYAACTAKPSYLLEKLKISSFAPL